MCFNVGGQAEPRKSSPRSALQKKKNGESRLQDVHHIKTQIIIFAKKHCMCTLVVIQQRAN